MTRRSAHVAEQHWCGCARRDVPGGSLRFVHEQLGDEVALPTSLISLISNGSLGGHGVGSSPLQRDGNASIGGVDGTSHPPVLAHQARCWFTKGGGRRLAVVLNVHYDDEVPYYTILMDGAERSTVRKYLLPLTFAEECMAGAGRAAEGRHVAEVQIMKVGPLGITLENTGDPLSPPQVTNITTGAQRIVLACCAWATCWLRSTVPRSLITQRGGASSPQPTGS